MIGHKGRKSVLPLTQPNFIYSQTKADNLVSSKNMWTDQKLNIITESKSDNSLIVWTNRESFELYSATIHRHAFCAVVNLISPGEMS